MTDTVHIRASSLSDLLDCPARWEARYLLGMRTPTSGAARLGTAVHAGTALYDQSTLDGAGLTPDDAAGAVVDVIRGHIDDDSDIDWSEVPIDKAEAKAIELHHLYCGEIAPQQDYHAVEIRCENLLVELDGISLNLTGTADRVRRTPVGLGIADIKTGKTAVGADGSVRTSAHRAQLGVYELLAEYVLGEDLTAPAQVIGLNSGKSRAGTGEIPDARQALIGPPDSPGVLEMAGEVLKRGLFWGNPRSMLCTPKYCPRFDSCNFR